MTPLPAALQVNSQENSFGAGGGSAANPLISKMWPNSSEAGGLGKIRPAACFRDVGKIGSQLLGGVAYSPGKSGAVAGLGERGRNERDQQEQGSD